MKKGDIYLIKRRDTIGAEIEKSRPGIIVSNDALNHTSGVVNVVLLTTQPKRDTPTHVKIHSTGCDAVALCEQIHCTSITLLGAHVGQCTAAEMEAVDAAIKQALALNTDVEVPAIATDPVNRPAHYTSGKIEVIDFIEDQRLGYHLGSAMAYICRAGKKDPTKTVEDLQKAVWYINREISRLQGTTE